MEPAAPHLGLTGRRLRETLTGAPRGGSRALFLSLLARRVLILCGHSDSLLLTLNSLLVLGHRRMSVSIETLGVTGLL